MPAEKSKTSPRHQTEGMGQTADEVHFLRLILTKLVTHKKCHTICQKVRVGQRTL